MYEGILLVALVVAVLLAIRPTVKHDHPLVIIKPGLYHATLAPQLERAQSLLDRIAAAFFAGSDIPSQFFSVDDPAGRYLLAAGCRSGLLYFQVIMPAGSGSPYQALHRFSSAVMVNIPLAASADVCSGQELRTAVEAAAAQLQMACTIVQDEVKQREQG